MKKNKLYTANKWNQPVFMTEANRFDWESLAETDKSSRPWNYVNDLDVTEQYRNSTNLFGISKQDNPFSKGNMAGGLGSMLNTDIGKGVAGAVGGIVGNAAYKGLSGGLDSGAGRAINGIGSTVGGALGMVNPVLGAAVTAASGIIGGGVNAAIGTGINQEKKAANDAGTAQLRNLSYSSDLDSIRGLQGVAAVQDAHKSGFLNKGWAKERNAADREDRSDALLLAQRNQENNVDNLLSDQIGSALARLSAYGGALDMGSGAIDYGFMSDYLTLKKHQAETRNKIAGLTQAPAFMPEVYALGGDIQSNGADWSTGLTRIDAGSSHELNPNEGVQVGVDSKGVPNLVEEGETIFDDYVYSTRILADAATKQMFRLPKKKDISFADISKKLEKEARERPNDPISQAGLEAQMHQLAEQQERQKQEMEAKRAKEAFEALSPEEQTAVMQQVAQQEQMAQQQAMAEQQQMEQPSLEEAAVMQQQQAMQADGSEANLGQEPQMNAMGGKLYAPGGYLWDKFWETVNEYSKKKGNVSNKYAIDKTYKGNIKDLEESEAYKAFTDYILNNATDEERLKYFRWIDDNTGRNRAYTNDKGELLDGWQDKYKAARTDGLYGIQHYTPDFDPNLGAPVTEAVQPAQVQQAEQRVFHAMDGDDYDGYIEGELDPNVVGAETRRETFPNGDTVIYHGRATNENSNNKEQGNVIPRHKWEGLRYAGLFGPAVGLGLQAVGVGKPNTASLDSAISGAGDVSLARYKPLGNYLTYRPLDIWYEQNRMNANARATDRAIQNASNGNSGAVMAGLLANGYNNQIASGTLFRQAQEYNDNLRKQVADFNRGTDQFNSEQYSTTSRFNAGAINDANRASKQLRLQAAAQKMDADAGWYNSLYGNIGGLFKGISDIGVENKRDNMINWMISKGIFGAVDPDDPEIRKRVKTVSAEGGRVKRKKSRRGLTF